MSLSGIYFCFLMFYHALVHDCLGLQISSFFRILRTSNLGTDGMEKSVAMAMRRTTSIPRTKGAMVALSMLHALQTCRMWVGSLDAMTEKKKCGKLTLKCGYASFTTEFELGI